MVNKRNREISARILNLIADNELTAYQIMKDLRLSSSVFYNCMNSKRSWSIENLIKVADRFGITLDYLIKGYPEQKFKTDKMIQEKESLEKQIAELKSYIKPAVELIDKAAESRVDYGRKKK